MISEPSRNDFERYSEFEEKKLDALADKIHSILVKKALPAARKYVRTRFPESGEMDFPRFDTLQFAADFTVSSYDNVRTRTLPQLSKFLGGCTITYVDCVPEIAVVVDIDGLFHNLALKEIDDETFEDLVLQVLLHEVMHALSISVYITDPAKRTAHAKWLAFQESLGILDPVPGWETLDFRYGFSCNFIAPESPSDPRIYRRFKQMDLMNEALTDIFASRAYSQYMKENGKTGRYEFGYPNEAKAFYYALRENCYESDRDFNEDFRTIEKGYFFSDDDYLDAFEDVVWPILKTFESQLA